MADAKCPSVSTSSRGHAPAACRRAARSKAATSRRFNVSGAASPSRPISSPSVHAPTGLARDTAPAKASGSAAPQRTRGSVACKPGGGMDAGRSEEHTSELQSPCNLVCRLLLEKKKKKEAKVH